MKKCFQIPLSLLLSLGVLTSAAFAADWPEWAADGRSWAQAQQIDESFLDRPQAVLTRLEAVELLYEAAGRPAAAAPSPFADAADDAAVAWAAAEGVVRGAGNGKFLPASPVTRQEFAAMLYRLAGAPAVQGDLAETFADAGAAAPWAEDALVWSTRTGLFSGRSGGALAPEATITAAEALTVLQRYDLLPDPQQVSADLQTLCTQPRPVGSDGERDAAQYLLQRFSAMGYQVSTQAYTDDAGRSGTTVVAVKPAADDQADILVISAHHDSAPSAYGANDNASGVAAMLAVAELVKDLPTDTELRFISFTDEEGGKKGSRAYVASLSEEERERIVGDIQIDMLGGLGSQGIALVTTDGEGNWLSDLLLDRHSGLPLSAEAASDHASFQMAEIPAVMVTQQGRGYLYHSAGDTADQIDVYTLSGAVQMIAAAVQEIAGPHTPSYRAVAREEGQGYVYRQTRQTVIYFSMSLEDTESSIGAAGTLTDTREISGDGWTDTYETYRYSMRWFDAETPMNTYYQYRNGYLESIEIHPAETGYTTAQTRALIEAMYGAPTLDEDGQTGWEDPIYGKYITLAALEDGGCAVYIRPYALGVSNVLASYPVKDGQAKISDPEDQAVWEYVCSILPERCRQNIAQFDLFTDGCSNILAFTAPLAAEGRPKNAQFSVSIDHYDVYDENGARRDWSKLTYTILHEYGHVLLEDETQVDLTQGESTHDPAAFVEGSFRKAFYDAFWQGIGDSAASDYETNPTHYVSQYGANYFHEDIADTFAVFVLSGKPEGKTVAEEKILFFWNDADMVQLRGEIRANLGLA